MNESVSPVVSVIVPVYNTAKYLRECLDSIVGQSLKEIEIVCVDDGSTDDSLAILREYREKDPRVVVVAQENAGVSVARNVGVKTARGKYMCFVDSDDSIDPDMCRKCAEIAEKHDADFTRFYNARDLRVVNRRFPKTRAFFDKRLKECYDQPTLDDRRLFVYLSGLNPCWSCLYRRDFWIDANLEFPKGIRYSEDTFVNFLASALGKRFAFFEADLYRYRRREGSASHPKSNAELGLFADAFITYREARDFYAKSDATAPLREPLAEIFAYMQYKIQKGLSRSERVVWRERVDELLDKNLRRAFCQKGSLPFQIRRFWLGLYGDSAAERAFSSAFSAFFIGLHRLEIIGKRRVVQPFRKRKDRRPNH